MSVSQKTREFAVSTALGPLMFLNGIPEYGPRMPATAQLLGGLVGTVLWIGLLNELLTVIL